MPSYNSKHRRQHTKAPLGAFSPFMSLLLTHPAHDVNDVNLLFTLYLIDFRVGTKIYPVIV